MTHTAIYPGTFDPITNGHLDIIKRSLKIFDNLIILLAKNIEKQTLFSLSERLKQITKIIELEKLETRVTVDCFEGLLVDYCKEKKINIMIRGLRPLVDFEYEFEMAMANREMWTEIETVFIITDNKYFYLRSSLIKDLVMLGGDISTKVPEFIRQEIIKKIKKS